MLPPAVLSDAEKNCLIYWLRDFEKNEKPYVIYGTGNITRDILQLVNYLGLKQPEYLIDHAAAVAEIEGFPIHSKIPGNQIRDTCVVIGSNTYHREIRERIIEQAGPEQQIFDFSHIRGADDGVREFFDNLHWKEQLRLLHGVSLAHGHYCVVGINAYTIELVRKIKQSSVQPPDFVFDFGNFTEKEIRGIPVCASSKHPVIKNCAVVYNAPGILRSEMGALLEKHIEPSCEFINFADRAVCSNYLFEERQSCEGPVFLAKTLFLGVNTKCNLCCKYCYDPEERRALNQQSDMPFEFAVSMLEQLKQHVSLLTLGSFGEPMLYPHLGSLIEKATKLGYSNIDFPTNAVLLTRDRSMRLARAGLNHIHVSLDTLDVAYNHEQRGIDTEQIINNIETFSKSTGLVVAINTVVTPQNLHLIHHLPELKLRVPTLKRIDPMPVTAQGDGFFTNGFDMSASQEKIMEAIARLEDRCQAYGVECGSTDALEQMNRKIRKKSCSRPWTHIYIDSNGDVKVCNSAYYQESEYLLGNVMKSRDILNVVRSTMAVEMRKRLMSGLLPKSCEGCKYAI